MDPRYEQSDEVLCSLAFNGDRVAEEQLVARYNRLVRVCARPYFLAGGDSEDLIQEGMIGLLSAIRGFQADKEALFRTYAEVCIRNRLRSAARAAARNKHSPLNRSVSLASSLYDQDSESYGADFLQPLESPEDMLIGREESRARIDAMREKLSSFEKTVLDLYLEGFSYGEIALQVNKPEKSVDNAVQRIRRKAAVWFAT